MSYQLTIHSTCSSYISPFAVSSNSSEYWGILNRDWRDPSLRSPSCVSDDRVSLFMTGDPSNSSEWKKMKEHPSLFSLSVECEANLKKYDGSYFDLYTYNKGQVIYKSIPSELRKNQMMDLSCPQIVKKPPYVVSFIFSKDDQQQIQNVAYDTLFKELNKIFFLKQINLPPEKIQLLVQQSALEEKEDRLQEESDQKSLLFSLGIAVSSVVTVTFSVIATCCRCMKKRGEAILVTRVREALQKAKTEVQEHEEQILLQKIPIRNLRLGDCET